MRTNCHLFDFFLNIFFFFFFFLAPIREEEPIAPVLIKASFEPRNKPPPTEVMWRPNYIQAPFGGLSSRPCYCHVTTELACAYLCEPLELLDDSVALHSKSAEEPLREPQFIRESAQSKRPCGEVSCLFITANL